MAESKGKSFVLKLGDGATSEAFTTVASLTNVSYTINGSLTDVTTKDSHPNRKILGAAGIISMSINATGVFFGDAAIGSIKGYVKDGSLNNYQVVDGDGTITEQGAFLVTSFEEAGGVDDSVTYTLTLESSGAVTTS